MLITDVVSSETGPGLRSAPEAALVGLLDRLVRDRNFFHGVDPAILGSLAILDPDLKAEVTLQGVAPPCGRARDARRLGLGTGLGLLSMRHGSANPEATRGGTFDRFRPKMAERAFEIERGGPPKVYGEWLGPYLKTLPDGIEPQDPANPGAG